jgi:DNA-binding XRE family transcriptional regulator
MVSKVRRLLAKMTKSTLASQLGIQNTNTIDQWTKRGVVPVKYHAKIEEVFNEFCK